VQELTEMITKESNQAGLVLPVTLQSTEVIEERKADLARCVTLLHVMAAMCETFGTECLSDNTQILLFVKVQRIMKFFSLEST
jgi:hypothetical protein